MRENDFALARLLKTVAPADRAELFDAAHADVDRRHARPNDQLLEVLPHDRRVAEIRRLLALPEVAQDEAETLRYTAHLGWSEAEPALSAASRRNLADDRATGYELLVALRRPVAGAGRADRRHQPPVPVAQRAGPGARPGPERTGAGAGPTTSSRGRPGLTRLVTDAVEAATAPRRP